MNSKENESVKISLKDFIMRYIRYIPLFIISIAIFLFLAYLYLRYTTPLYNARASLLIKTDKPQRGMGEEFDEVFFTGGRGNMTSEMEILKSVNIAKRVAPVLDRKSVV